MQQEGGINLASWLDEPTHDEAIEMMRATATVQFGTALWPL